jgi:hypothetical protein
VAVVLGVAVCEDVGVTVKIGVIVAPIVCVGVAVGIGVKAPVGAGVGVGVAVGIGVKVPVGAGVRVAVDVGWADPLAEPFNCTTAVGCPLVALLVMVMLEAKSPATAGAN